MLYINLIYPDYNGKPSVTQIVVASSIGLIIAAAMHYRLKKLRDRKIIPLVRLSKTGQSPKLERFSHYVGTYLFNINQLMCVISFKWIYDIMYHLQVNHIYNV